MWIASLILGIIGIAASMAISSSQSEDNKQAVQDTNATNLQGVRETNASNVEQAELAYQRSLPTNQVSNLMAAGFSRAGALNKLTGGGTYSAPVLQSAHADAPQVDYSQVASAFERLGNIPSNTEQFQIQEQQLEDLKQQAKFRANEERRKQEMHDAIIDEKNYSKWERESMDDFMSLMENIAQEKNIQPSSNQSMHDYVRALGLQDNDMYKKLPVSARQRAFDKFKQIQEEKRAQNIEERSRITAEDAHDIAIKHKEQLQQQIDDFNESVDARMKEYHARALVAELSSMASELNISEQELRESLEAYRGKDGKLHQKPERSISPIMQNFWNTIFDIIPIGTLSDAFFRGLKLGK